MQKEAVDLASLPNGREPGERFTHVGPWWPWTRQAQKCKFGGVSEIVRRDERSITINVQLVQ
jgi:hypothetical protein